MSRLATALSLLAVLLWSALVWGGYALLGWGGHVLANNVGLLVQPPELEPYTAWVRVVGDNIGQGAVIVLWLIGIGLIVVARLAVGLILRRFAPAPTAAPVPGAPSWGRNAAGR